MARSGLTKAQVRSVRDRMLADGKYPSVDAVRHALGDSGSKSTIHKYLRELRDEDPDVGLQRDDTEEALRAVVGQLAERLHANADARIKARIAALQAAHDDVLHQKEEELAALRATVAALSARVTQLETRRAGDSPGDEPDDERYALARGWRTPRPDQAHAGFGRFDSGLLSSRSGPGASSPFDMIRTVARS
ncbi:DNA-binding protein [Massilia phyllosphaerae]|uniref:DNA-binding protein n=1 Tax=Massilia phyllosphaerae TaxID=3106034 RepID=UPI002B1CCD40|nr:DNA-binding protein [Massilia sp. SGZ-792]